MAREELHPNCTRNSNRHEKTPDSSRVKEKHADHIYWLSPALISLVTFSSLPKIAAWGPAQVFYDNSSPYPDRHFSLKCGFVPSFSFTLLLLYCCHQHAFKVTIHWIREVSWNWEGMFWTISCISTASWFVWPSCNIFIDIPCLCLPSRGEEEHMVFHLLLEIIPSLSKRGMIFPSFQSINYSWFIVFYYRYELLKIKLDRIF